MARLLPSPRSFRIDFEGRSYGGNYQVEDDVMKVGSAYGSKNQRISKSADLDKVAKLLLRQIVEAYEKARPR